MPERLLLDAVAAVTLFIRRDEVEVAARGSIKLCRAGKATLRTQTYNAGTCGQPRYVTEKHGHGWNDEHHRHNFENRDGLMQRAADHIAQRYNLLLNAAAWPCWLWGGSTPKALPC